MALLEIITVGVIGRFLYKTRKESLEKKAEEERRKSILCKFADDIVEDEEDERRPSTSCEFSDGISEYEFGLMVCKAGRFIKRLETLYASGAIVYGTVRSQSMLSTWSFQIDFNDYGHITGSYWITSENSDSTIPLHIAKDISESILSYPKCRGELFKYAPREEKTEADKETENYDYNGQFESTSEEYKNRETSDDVEQNEAIEKERTKQEQERTKREKQRYEYQERREKREEAKNTKIVIGVILLIFLLTGVFFYLGERENIEHKRNNDIQVFTSAENLEKKNFEEVKEMLSSAGFKNIKFIKDEDLVLGVFAKDGEVEKVTINGNSEFSANDWFPSDAKVKITYHTYK